MEVAIPSRPSSVVSFRTTNSDPCVAPRIRPGVPVPAPEPGVMSRVQTHVSRLTTFGTRPMLEAAQDCVNQ